MLKKTLFILYFILIHCLLIVIAIKPEIINMAGYKLGFHPKTYLYDQTLIRHLQYNWHTQDNDIVFLGDSIIEKMPMENITPTGANLGISMDWTDGLLKRIPLYRSLDKARVIVVSVGVNDLSLKLQTVEDSFKRYQQLADLLPKQSTLIFNSVLPLGEKRGDIRQLNAKIEQLNALIQSLASTNDLFLFLDTAQQMSDANGYLKAEYHRDDNLHLNQQGYQAFTQAIKVFLIENKLL